MKIAELLERAGGENVSVQELIPAITNLERRPKSGRGVSAVTFLTTHLSPSDALNPSSDVGYILWFKRDAAERALAAFNIQPAIPLYQAMAHAETADPNSALRVLLAEIKRLQVLPEKEG